MQVAGDQLEIRVNENSLRLDANGPSDTHTLRGWAAESKENYISIGTCNGISTGGCNMNTVFDVNGRDLNVVDNLTITTVGPEIQKPAASKHSEAGEDTTERVVTGVN